MVLAHGDHRLGKTEASKKLETAVRHLDGAISREAAFENKRAASAKVDDRVSKRKVTIQRFWVPSQREIGIFISQWLISAGMPHHTVATEEFKLLIQRLTGDSGATILAASTFRDLLLAVFAKFCKMTKGLLMREFKAVLGLPFLNLHHDGWTTANGRVGATGTLASFIDASWTFHEVALLLTVGHTSHASADVHKMICSRMKSVYEVDIDPMIQFTILDTTASARKVSKLFEDSQPTDCTMHTLNLCLQYAMGMRENKETVEVFDPKTNSRKREQRYVTVGGVFEEGRDLVKRLAPTLDCDTRVAFTVKLFQRSILNFSAFRGYFQNPEKGDDATVFTKLTMDDWHLMAEMEALARSLTSPGLKCSAMISCRRS
ncbi:hypothetical protein PR003_g15077 [Phytophthora rubi]|uniref:MULE transposase domain-containing protein n=1 Tax=Phytophthora rubi TaxID=129364 RepID=A0A6A4F0U2_9STRA|nr:hypothetical protein PR003_g15077 [Phytophthora rubi]